MPGLCTTVATDKDIESFFGGNETKVLVLGLCAFADTARNSAFEFVWTTNGLVALFETHSHAYTIANAEAAPCSSNA